MIRGVSVVVHHPTEVVVDTQVQRDRFGNVVRGVPTDETVDNVLVSPGSTADLEAARPEGVRVAYSLHFPRGYSGELEGCSITLPAPWSQTVRVIGNPKPYIDVDTPTPWNLPVECEVAHG